MKTYDEIVKEEFEIELRNDIEKIIREARPSRGILSASDCVTAIDKNLFKHFPECAALARMAAPR